MNFYFQGKHSRLWVNSSINNFSDPFPKWAQSPLGNCKATPCGTYFPKGNFEVGCLKLMGANSCLRLSLSAEHFLR